MLLPAGEAQDLTVYNVHTESDEPALNVHFPTLQGLRTRQEGLVHVQNMSKTRVGSAKDVVKRGQEVWVKVISMQGQKISLSMRDVDQVSARVMAGVTCTPAEPQKAILHAACAPMKSSTKQQMYLSGQICVHACHVASIMRAAT